MFCSGCVTQNKNCKALQWIKSPFSIATLYFFPFCRIWTNLPPSPRGAEPVWSKTAWVSVWVLVWKQMVTNLIDIIWTGGRRAQFVYLLAQIYRILKSLTQVDQSRYRLIFLLFLHDCFHQFAYKIFLKGTNSDK